MKRPIRMKKTDRLFYPDAAKEEIACDVALAPLDAVARQYDRKWGTDRLPELVSPATAQRYGYAMADLNAALEKNDPAAVLATANNCIKGMHVMDAEATAMGAATASADYLEYELDGFRFAIMKDDRNWTACKDARPDLEFYTLREVGVALRTMRLDHPMVTKAKAAFGGAEISAITPPKTQPPVDYKNGGDAIPF